MVKGTVSIVRTGKVEKALGLGAGRIVEGIVTVKHAGTIHASDLELRTISSVVLMMLKPSPAWTVAASVVTPGSLYNMASVYIGSMRWLSAPAGSVRGIGTPSVAGSHRAYCISFGE